LDRCILGAELRRIDIARALNVGGQRLGGSGKLQATGPGKPDRKIVGRDVGCA